MLFSFVLILEEGQSFYYIARYCTMNCMYPDNRKNIANTMFDIYIVFIKFCNAIYLDFP